MPNNRATSQPPSPRASAGQNAAAEPPQNPISAYIRKLNAEGETNILRKLRMAGIDPATGLRGLDLAHTNLHGLDMSGVDFSGCNLRWADLGNCKLTNGKMVQASPVQARLDNSNLAGADLRGANFHQASLRAVDLRGADLRGARLSEAVLLGSLVEGALWDEPLSALEPFLTEPERLLGSWDNGPDEDNPLGHNSLRLLFDSLALSVMTAIIFGDAGLDPGDLNREHFPQLLTSFVLHDIENIGDILDSERKELLLDRRQQVKKGSGDVLAELDRQIGMRTLFTRNYDQATEHLQAARHHFHHRRKVEDEAAMCGVLGLLAFDRLDPVNAVKLIREAMTRYEEAGNFTASARCGLSLAAMALLHGRMDRVQQFVAKAAQALEKDRDPGFMARQSIVAGLMAWKNGDPATAYKMWDGGRSLLARLGDEIDAAICAKLCEGIGRLTG